ncbi:unnamed protein product [Symbiodinium sp. CCMP2592]|nr:unnamed protein product [Symbiodinium sp. CCMP2592]
MVQVSCEWAVTIASLHFQYSVRVGGSSFGVRVGASGFRLPPAQSDGAKGGLARRRSGHLCGRALRAATVCRHGQSKLLAVILAAAEATGISLQRIGLGVLTALALRL